MTIIKCKVKPSDLMSHFIPQIVPEKDNSKKYLKRWLKKSKNEVEEMISQYGGLYLKGFELNTAQDFEDIAHEICPDLCSTHPFNCSTRMWYTKYSCEVQSPEVKASIIPKGLHNEDSYVGYIPGIIMFYSLEPAVQGGETLLADCQKIYELLPESLKKKCQGKSMINNLTMHNDILLVNSQIPKSIQDIESLGYAYGAKKVERISEDLTNFCFEIPTIIKNVRNSKPLWFNLNHIFPRFSFNVCIDTWFAYNQMGGSFNKIKAIFIGILILIKDFKFLCKKLVHWNSNHPDFLSEISNYKFSDGTAITFVERVLINLAIWKCTIKIPLEKGDLVVLDNRRVSHGRMPFKGRRTLLTAIGSLTNVEAFETS